MEFDFSEHLWLNILNLTVSVDTDCDRRDV